MHHLLRRIGCISACVLLLTLGHAALALERGEEDSLGKAIESADKAQSDTAVATVRKYLEARDESACYSYSQWVKSLIKAKRYDDASELATLAILGIPNDTTVVESFQRSKVKALKAAGKQEEALSAAKALYNVASMEMTSDALQILSDLLPAARPQEAGIAERFRLEQINGATTRPAGDADAQSAPAATTQGSNILQSIRIDPKPYEARIASLTAENFVGAAGRGNLLLLSDRPADARKEFEKIAGYPAEAKEIESRRKMSAEGIARSIKAEDGTIGRANGWVLSLRTKKD